MLRSTRQSKILELIQMKNISTQEELSSELAVHGFKVTQATVSRDIKELGLIKAMNDKGEYKYVTVSSVEQKVPVKLINVFKEAVITFIPVNNLLIIKTLSGSAGAVANVVDQLNPREMLGSVAGDDTLLIIAENAEAVDVLLDKLVGLTKM